MHKFVKSSDRGTADHGWLQSYHTFSFAEYYNPKMNNFHSLRVINEDIVAPGKGFSTHPHKNMEIITYIISGELSHKDSMGNVKTVGAGEVQAMTAGSGVTHSEFNPSSDKEVHLLQIWILPNKSELSPTYSEWKPQSFQDSDIQLIASNREISGVIKIHQNSEIAVAKFNSATKQTIYMESYSAAWIQLISGSLQVDNLMLSAGDAVGIENQDSIEISTDNTAHFLIFKLE